MAGDDKDQVLSAGSTPEKHDTSVEAVEETSPTTDSRDEKSPNANANDAPPPTTTTTAAVPVPAAEIKAVLAPIAPASPAPGSVHSGSSGAASDFTPLVTVVGFHHARGPEVESWFGADEAAPDPAADYNWHLLPFMALSDGAHASEEDFSYFTLLRPATPTKPACSLFGLSCTRQLDSAALLNRSADVTRSTVQKAVVVIADSPHFFGVLRERLGMVTHAWFAQRDFTDVEILRRFQESLADEKARGDLTDTGSRDQYLGMSLRELIHEYKWQTLVLLKCCLLQPKMLFFGSRCDKLCMIQFALISLIPGLIRNLQDCADPELNAYEEKLAPSTSLQSSNRSSLLQFMGLPLQIFGKGAIFGPYTPLQQLDMLADVGTKSYLVGSTNSLLLQQRDRYSDILINLDEGTVNITSPSLKAALALTAADRRWIDSLTHQINETWDETNPSRPKTLQYAGSEEYIRSQFESYILGLISSVKFHNFLAQQGDVTKGSFTSEEDPAVDFGLEWIAAWQRTENYRIWEAHTDANLFAVSEPKHPCAGGLTIDDVQRRIADQVKDLHLDERLAQGREMLGRNLAAGREKASSMFSKLYSDMEYLRESQRRRADEAAAAVASSDKYASGTGNAPSVASPTFAVDMTKAQATMQSVGTKAGAYMSSWASWAGEKRKNNSWAANWRNSKSGQPKNNGGGPSTPTSPIDKDYQMISAPGSRAPSTDDSRRASATTRPLTQQSFSESILSRASSSFDRPLTGESVVDRDDRDTLGVTTISSTASEDTASSVDPAVDKKIGAGAGGGKQDGFQTEELVGSNGTSKKSASQESTKTPPTPVALTPPATGADGPDNAKTAAAGADETK
ncbi:LAlv9 family protein [Cordyceps fumosorosea ARSEF 2679]|uniref:LAlv9 family protein n=1 Tax=Cordyceps fumosorosea (strain ARSEF 2679) TaxID=1081104 RepID=A0A167U868_CORFA|nr:LAlv9 family protein [Cordyceps fumosorosea ARSEF 2679]OAA61325.1 LAlv9 family protein [Cordyceps fumosorosea ARSEF 2679]